MVESERECIGCAGGLNKVRACWVIFRFLIFKCNSRLVYNEVKGAGAN